jgi:hypothetical protein
MRINYIVLIWSLQSLKKIRTMLISSCKTSRIQINFFFIADFVIIFAFRNEIIICVISSNIAILLLFNDQTSHFRFKISFQIMNETICNIICNTHLYKFLQRMKLIIWYEILMQHKHYFTFVHRTFTNLLQNEHIFDDIFMILNDDFAQILLVMTRDNREMIINANIQQCFLWSRFQQLILR